MDEQTLNLDYPCEWEYRVIGSEPDALEQAVKDVMGARVVARGLLGHGLKQRIQGVKSCVLR